MPLKSDRCDRDLFSRQDRKMDECFNLNVKTHTCHSASPLSPLCEDTVVPKNPASLEIELTRLI